MTTQNPAVPKNHNAMMSAAGWGTVYVKVMSIDHGISIVSDSSTMRFSRVLYLKRQTDGTFSMNVECTSYAEHVALGEWLRGYARQAADPDATVGPVRVIMPERNFDKIAVPDSATFGDAWNEITYPATINFVGANDSVPHTGDYVSSFTMPSGDLELPYYYPAGHALGGSADTLYDQTDLDRANQAATDRLTAQYQAWLNAQKKPATTGTIDQSVWAPPNAGQGE